MSVRHATDQSLAARATTPLSRTIFVLAAVSSMNTNRVESSVPCSRIQRRRDLPVPAPPRAGFFLNLILCRANNRHSAVRLPAIRRLRITASTSSSVKSGCFAIKASNQFACFSNGEVLPPRGMAVALPSSCQPWESLDSAGNLPVLFGRNML
jgi:hypothetical protein